jgi:acyl-CoA synthetase (AMP-forming)/AMP-acid ligase II
MQNLDPISFDRTDFLPRHEGPNVLPHDILFHVLHSLAAYQNNVVVKDAKSGHVATHQQFLSDIVACRNALRDSFAPETIAALQAEREVSVLILSHGYEFVVSFFAILAIGAIAVPLSMY